MRAAKWIAMAIALLTACVLLLAWWAASSRTALEWAIAQLVIRSHGALHVEGVSGALDGTIGVRRVVYRTSDLHVELTDLELDPSRAGLVRGQLILHSAGAATLLVRTISDGKPLHSPSSLAMPLEIDVRRAAIRRAEINEQSLRDIAFAYRAGAWGQAVSGLSANTGFGRVALDGRVEAASPFALEARAEIKAASYAARTTASGNLLRLDLAASGEMHGARASAKARFAPYAERWLEDLDAHAERVNLSAFDARLPQTNLDIDVTGAAAGSGLPAGTLAAINRTPGTVTAKRVPLVRLAARYALLDQETVELADVHGDLGAAGAVSGSARLGKQSSRFDLSVRALDLRSVHAPLRSTRLNGSLSGRIAGDEQHVVAKLSERGVNLAFDATRRGDAVVLREIRASMGRSELVGKAELSLALPRPFTLAAKLVQLDPSQFGDYPRASINGRVSLAGVLDPEWRVEGTLALADSVIRNVRFAGDVQASVSRSGAQNVKIALRAGQNALQASGSVGRAGDALKFVLDAKRASELDPRLAGALTASGRVAGEIARPEFELDISGSGLVWQDNLRLRALRARASGSLVRHSADVQAAGDGFDATARVEGGWDAQRGWSGQVLSLENAGATPAKLLGPMPLAYGRGRLVAGPAQAQVADGLISLAALSWQEGKLDTRGELARVPVAPLLRLAGMPASPTNLRINGRWTLAATPRLNGTLSLTRESGDIVLPGDTPLPLSLEQLRLDATIIDGALDATLMLQAQSASGRVHAAIAALERNAALKLDGRIEIGSLRVFDPLIGTNALVKGQATLVVAGGGTLGTPQITATLAAANLGIEAPQHGVRLRDGTLRAELTATTLILRELSIFADEGRISASGVMSRSDAGERRLEWRAENARVLNRPDMRLKVDGGGTAALAGRKLVLRGGLKAVEGHFQFDRPQAPRLGSDVVVIGRPRAAGGAGIRSRFETQLLDVDVTLEAGDRLRLVGAGLDTYLTGKLHLKTGSRGVIEARGVLSGARGVYYALGQRLEIERGRLIFDGPLDNPALDVLAKRRHLSVEAGVLVRGTVRVPSVTLVSDPPVSDSEKLAWLTLGHGLQDATRADLGLLQAAASALVSGGNAVPLTQQIANRIGLDELSLRGSGEARSQVAAFSKRLSDKLYVEYEQGLAATSSVLRLSYLLTRSLSLRLEAGFSSGFGLYFTRSYD